MKYTIEETSYRSWVIEKEDGIEYYVSSDFAKLPRICKDLVFKCSCVYNTRFKKECSHIRFIKEHLVSGKKVFEK